MTTQLDATIAMGVETTYGTPVAPTRAFEFTDESFDWDPNFVQGEGMRVGTRLPRSARRKTGKKSTAGDLTVEATSKGMGMLFKSVLGAATVTQIASGPAYQQVHTPATSDYLASYTIQKGIPPLGGGATLPHTFSGCIGSSFDASISNGDILKVKFAYLGRDVDTTTAYAAPSYPASPVEEFVFSDGAITIGGTVTMPTTTALATGGTAVADIRDWQLSWDNKLDTNGFNFGANGLRGRPNALGLAEAKGKITAEFDTTALRDAYLNQTDLALVMTFKGQTLLTTGVYPTLQFVIPNIRLEGELPKANGGDVVTQSIDYTVLDNLTATSPLYVVYVSTDTAV